MRPSGFSIISDGGTGAFESVAFMPPTENLTLDAGDGDDQADHRTNR